jgi:predicted anti-sigma-YlaC factor YlaD
LKPLCTRYQSDGMRWLDGELSASEAQHYQAHVGECHECRRELASLGRIVRMTDELRLRPPDDEFWKGYWESVYRRSERRVGFVLLVAGILAVLGYGVFRALKSPSLFTYEGISVMLILVGLLVIFISVVRERYHESKNDPYQEVER